VVKLSIGVDNEIRVSFSYDPQMVAAVKSVGGGQWRPEGKYWSFAHSEETLNRLIDAFSREELEIDPSLQPFSQDNLIKQVRKLIRTKHYSIRTEKSYLPWITRYAQYHGNKDPRGQGEKEIEAFLSHLAVDLRVSASTQNQAFNALLFLYRDVLKVPLAASINAVRAKRPVRLPTVMTREETMMVIGAVAAEYQLTVKLIYGAGLRIMECLRLRVKDIDFPGCRIIVRDAKGMKDRVTVLPKDIAISLDAHLERVRLLHRNDLADGYGTVYLPHALERKYPRASAEWAWQYVFPARSLSRDPRSGKIRRHHIHETAVQKAVRTAAQMAGIPQPISVHTLRHYSEFRIIPSSIVGCSSEVLLGQEILPASYVIHSA
jgi:integron integrase